MKTKILILSAASLLMGIFYGTSQNYDPNFFPIGVWSIRGDFRPVDDFLYNEDTAGQYHQDSFQNLKDQGFNAVYLSYDPIGYTLDTILNIAEAKDMKVIAPMQNLYQLISQSNEQEVTNDDIVQAIENDSIARLKSSSAVMGYYLYDEPLPGWIDFDVLENARNILTNMTSDAPHPILSCWNDEQHMSYIDSYLNLDVLMMDTYPFEDGDALGDLSDYMPSYFSEGDPMPFSEYLDTVRMNHCEPQDRPMWVVFQAFGDLETPENGGYWRQVYPKEIRLQAYLSIMQGAKGLWYFLYESEYPYLLGLLDVSGQPTQRLTEVEDINNEINTISDTLLKLSVYSNQFAINSSQGEVKLHVDNTSDNQDKYVICVNTDIFAPSNSTISVEKSAVGYEVLSVVDMYSNENIEFTDTGDAIVFDVSINEGSGRLLKLSDQNLFQVEIADNVTFSVYPSPSLNELFIKSKAKKEYKYEIFNTLGKIVLNGRKTDNSPIGLNSIKSGIYYIHISNGDSMATLKFIKQ